MLGQQPRPQGCSRRLQLLDAPLRLHIVEGHWLLGSHTKIVSHARRVCRPRISSWDMVLLGYSGIVAGMPVLQRWIGFRQIEFLTAVSPFHRDRYPVFARTLARFTPDTVTWMVLQSPFGPSGGRNASK